MPRRSKITGEYHGSMPSAHRLEPILDLKAAAGLKESLLRMLSGGQPLVIDASQVTRISTACIQLIAAMLIAAREAGIPVTVEPTSPVFVSGFTGLGLNSVVSGKTS